MSLSIARIDSHRIYAQTLHPASVSLNQSASPFRAHTISSLGFRKTSLIGSESKASISLHHRGLESRLMSPEGSEFSSSNGISLPYSGTNLAACVRFASVHAKQHSSAAAKITFRQMQSLPKPQLQVAQLCASSSTGALFPRSKPLLSGKINNPTAPPRYVFHLPCGGQAFIDAAGSICSSFVYASFFRPSAVGSST